MLRFSALALFAVALPACLEPKQCASDDDCEGGYCHPTYQFCVFDDAGATGGGGGGGTTGGGGGTLGGGGGTTGGGGGTLGGGGGTTGGGGGTTGGGGGQTGGGGGQTGGGGGQTGGGGGQTGGGVGGGATGGGGGDTGGGDGSGGGANGGGGGATGGGGGATGGGGGAVANCDAVNCFDPYECEPSMSGGRCVPAYVLSFVSPDAGVILGPQNTTIVFAVRATLKDGGTGTLQTVPISVPGWNGMPTILSGVQGPIISALVSVPITQATFVATAGWTDGGPVTTRTIAVDRITPTAWLEVGRSLDGGAHPRDGLLPVALHSNEPLSAVNVRLVGTDGGMVAQTINLPQSACVQRNLNMGTHDVCRQVDLASVPFAAFTGTLGLEWDVADPGGNVASDAGITVSVSRLRWRTDAIGGNAKAIAAPAIDSLGNLYVGTMEGVANGRLISYSPSGAVRYTRTDVGSVQSVAVSFGDVGPSAQEVVYVASNTTEEESRLFGYAALTGNTIGSRVACTSARLTHSAMALYAGTATGNGFEARAAIVQNPTTNVATGAVCTWGPRDGPGALVGTFAMPSFADGSVPAPANLIANGSTVYFQHVNRELTSVSVATLLPQVGGGSGQFAAGAVGTGLAFGNGTIFATWSNATVPLATYNSSDNFNGPTLAPATGSGGWGTTAYGLALGPNTAVVTSNDVASGDWLMSFATNGGAPPLTLGGPVSAPTTGSVSYVAPVLGTGSKLYAVRSDGTLLIYDVPTVNGTQGRAPEWSVSLFGGGADVRAHPNLDCNRFAAGRNGTLYVVAGDGRVAAVIVDSTKLEPTARWPRWQRNSGNAGNAAAVLNQGCP